MAKLQPSMSNIFYQLHAEALIMNTLSHFLFLFSAAPPVTFTDIAEEDLFKTVVEKEELLLTCEVSRADGVIQWYKDGVELQQGHNTTIQADGTKRNLTICSAQLSDTGTYTCRAGDNVLMFKVNIRGEESVTEPLYTKHFKCTWL